jgi:hypothetical protein
MIALAKLLMIGWVVLILAWCGSSIFFLLIGEPAPSAVAASGWAALICLGSFFVVCGLALLRD